MHSLVGYQTVAVPKDSHADIPFEQKCWGAQILGTTQWCVPGFTHGKCHFKCVQCSNRRMGIALDTPLAASDSIFDRPTDTQEQVLCKVPYQWHLGSAQSAAPVSGRVRAEERAPHRLLERHP